MKKHIKRYLSLALALCMLLPLISVPTFAADGVTAFWSQNFDGGESLGSLFREYGSGLGLTTADTDAGNRVAELDFKPHYTAEYYFTDTSWRDEAGRLAITVTDVEGDTLTGTFTSGGVTYSVTGTINRTSFGTTATATATDGSGATLTRYIVTGAYLDAHMGYYSIARRSTLYHPEMVNDGVNDFILEMNAYIPSETDGIKTSGQFMSYVEASDEGYNFALNLFMIVVSGGVATIGAEVNQEYVTGDAASFPLDRWNRISVVIDRVTSHCSVYLNGTYVCTMKNNGGASDGYYTRCPDSALTKLNANTLNFQIRKYLSGHEYEATYNQGYAQVDDFAFYYSTESAMGLVKPPVKQYTFDTEDQDSYTEVGKPSNNIWNHSTSIKPSTTEPFNNVLYISTSLIRKEYNYYYWNSGTSHTGSNALPIPNDAVELTSDGKLQTKSGQYVTINDVNYTFSNVAYGQNNWNGVTMNQVDGTGTLGGYVISAELHDTYDSWVLSHNHAFRLQSDKWLSSSVQDFVISMDWYFEAGTKGTFTTEVAHYNGSSEEAKQPIRVKLDGTKGTLTTNYEKASGADVTLELAKWYNVTIVIDKDTSLFSIYVDGNIAFTTYCGLTADTAYGDIPYDGLRMYFGDSGYKQSPANFAGGIEIDNITYSDSLNALGEVVTVDPENLLYVEVNGEKVYDNTFYVAPGTSYTPVYFDTAAYEGMLITEKKNSVRLTAPTGLRFATQVDVDRLNQIFALLDAGDVADVEFGHLIAPTDYITDNSLGELTMAGFEAAGVLYMSVPATRDAYYSFDSDTATTHFVGSIVDLYEHNIDRDFTGRGYVSITLHNGRRIDLYSVEGHSDNVKAVANDLLAKNPDGYEGDKKTILETFARGEAPEISDEALFTRALYNKNVLAIGDSLFHGHELNADQTWLALVAKQYNWTFTNQGRNGATVAMVSGKYSMWDHMRDNNDLGYRFGGTTPQAYHYGNVASVADGEVDYILLEGGINDYHQGVALGSTDGNTATYLGAMDLMIQKLKTLYPNATIILIGAWHIDGGTATLSVDGLKSLKIGKYKDDDKVVFCDAGNPALNGGVDMNSYDFRVQYGAATDDLYHLNAEGMKLMAEAMPQLIYDALVNKII